MNATTVEARVPVAPPAAVIDRLLQSVGNTPLVELGFADDLPAGVRLFGKLESCNPGASIKDRPVLRMLSRARAAGRFRGGRRLLDSSSGNAGIAYAQFGAAFGVGVTLVVPGNASRERLERIRAHGATLTGVGRRLRQSVPDVHITCIVPEIFPGIEGLKPLGQPNDFVPEILDQSLIDRRIEITIDQALAMCRRLARRGLFVGPSSGAYVHAALEVASSGRYKTVVTLLSDSGERYGSTGMWGTEAPED